MANTSVSQKMKAFQARQKGIQQEASLEEIEKMSLSELAKETVQFGTAKKGLKFGEAFKDYGWTEWFVSHYEKSQKVSHRKYIRFVELTLEEEAVTESNEKAKKWWKDPTTSAASVKSEPSEAATWEKVKPVDITESESESDALKFSHLEEEVVYMRAETRQLGTRMTNMENAMQEIVQHLRQLSVKTES